MIKDILKLDSVKQLTKKEQKETEGGIGQGFWIGGTYWTGGSNEGNSIPNYGGTPVDDGIYSHWKFICYIRGKIGGPVYRSYTDESDAYTVCYPL